MDQPEAGKTRQFCLFGFRHWLYLSLGGKLELFTKLADHLSVLAAEVERAVAEGVKRKNCGSASALNRAA
ncbi:MULTISPECIES: hypothetical protein [unclassified Bradyrhizobium]|uniref:hypothetical protein n=1 Tax=Bradyrhizobium sp. 142 TaxID=2782618 RepID=UPI001FF7F336|nr:MULTISPECIES: hypothetical protein [unclassified Bradyrhizobium]MCK1731534.1 hypothetical protein [Bradyrhizobium sp. 142]